MKLVAFHNDRSVKQKYVDRLAEHRRLENLTQGIGFETNGVTKGCAVGCTLNVYDHSRYPVELGLSEHLAYLEDAIFEGLPTGDAEQFAQDFLDAIPVGADTSDAWRLLAIRRHERQLVALEDNAEPYAIQCRAAIQGVIDWLRAGANESAAESAESAAESAESAAWSAARSAAWSATRSATWSAARSARSAAWSARSATWSAARSAESAAWSEHYQWEAQELLSILRACKTAAG